MVATSNQQHPSSPSSSSSSPSSSSSSSASSSASSSLSSLLLSSSSACIMWFIPKPSLGSIVVLFSALTGFLMGFDLSIISVVLNSINDEYSLCPAKEFTCFKKELFVAMIAPGALIGSLFGGFVADYFGRRLSLILSDILFIIGSVGFWFTSSFTALLVNRSIIGSGVGIGFVVFSTYVSEIAPSDRRGRLVLWQEIAQCIGVLVTFLLGALIGDQHWRFLLSSGAICAVVQLCGIQLLPESPRWLITRGRIDEARKVMKKLGLSKTLVETSIGNNSTNNNREAAAAADAAADGSYFSVAILGIPDSSNVLQQMDKQQNTLGDSVVQQQQQQRRPLIPTASITPMVKAADGSSSSSSQQSSPDGDRSASVVVPVDPSVAASAQTAFDLSETDELPPPSEFSELPLLMRTASFPASLSPSSLSSMLSVLKCLWESRRILLIACGIGIAQNLLCTNATLYFSADLMLIARICRPYEWGIGFGLMKLLGTVVVYNAVDRLGRRVMLLLGTGGLFFSFLLLSFGYSQVPSSDLSEAGWFCLSPAGAQLGPSGLAEPYSVVVLLGLFVFLFFWEISWAGLVYVVAAEILPSEIRGIGMGFVVSCFWTSLFISQLAFEYSFRVLTVMWSFFWLSAAALLVLVFTFLTVPDFTNRSLESISRTLSTVGTEAESPGVRLIQGGTPDYSFSSSFATDSRKPLLAMTNK